MATRYRTRRAKWVERRRRGGLGRPAEVWVRTVNCASVSLRAATAADVFRRALSTPVRRWVRKAARRRLVDTDRRPDVVLASECADFDAEDIAGDGYQVAQRGPVGSPESALVIAVRRDRCRLTGVELDPGIDPTSEGGGIRRRPVLRATVVLDEGTRQEWSFPVAVGHAHPPRAPRARAAFIRLMRSMRGVLQGADWNLPMRLISRALGRRVQGIGVLGTAVPSWIPTSPASPVDHGSDHAGVDVPLWPSKKEHHR